MEFTKRKNIHKYTRYYSFYYCIARADNNIDRTFLLSVVKL